MSGVACLALVGCYEAHRGADREGLPFDGGGTFHEAGLTPDGANIFHEAGLPPDGGGIFHEAGVPPDGGGAFHEAGMPPDGGGIFHEAGLPPDGGGIFHEAGTPHDVGPLDVGIGSDAGRRSVALRFSENTYVFAPDRPGLRVSADATYEMWIRPRGTGIVSVKGQREGQRHLYVAIDTDADGRAVLVVGWVNLRLESRLLRAPIDHAWDRWTHVATVFERVSGEIEMRLYVDLVEVAAGRFPGDLGDAFNVEPLVLGQFDGDIDEVRLWRSVRSLDTLRATAFMTVPSGTPSLALYWPIEEAPGQLLLDRSLRGNDAILGALNTPDSADPVWISDGAL